MNKTSTRRPTISAGFAVGLLVLASSTQAHAAGGAFAVDDSEVGTPGECKVESWASFADNDSHDFVGAVAPACVANLGRPVELGVQVQRSRADGEWATGLTLKAKTNIIPLEGNTFGLGISGSTSWDLTASENTGGSINLPVTFEISKQLKVNLNAGWLYERQDDLHWFTWGTGFEWQFAEKFTLIGEVFGQVGNHPALVAGEPPAPDSIREPRLQAGLRYTPVEKIDIDLIYGRNITGEDANWVTLGLNVRF
jgi:hypothetical protein